MTKPVLISFKLCPFVQRSVINLLEKKVDYDIKYIDLANKPDWFLKISPFGKVPVLQVGDDVIFESAVINEYLDETSAPALHPKDPIKKAKHRSWTEFASALLVDQYGWTMAKEKSDSDKKREELLSKFKILEAGLPTQEGKSLYFAGEKMHLVDTAFAPFFMRLQFLADHKPELYLLKDFPKIQKWSETLLSLPSVKNSVLPEVPKEYLEFIKAHHSWMGGIL
ncbi:glutathione S-transferase family protein [Leptospira kanakyensis]|uniref:glutathione S-transferase family protein n=1 Tax=Leptospira kanakyensis TaxID=2484968 RepID=UPI00223DA70C|nr:glutathione S-transferase family protein [Leptospira kanakyensis]MCW7471270.1 glutathione S-transferase family protein [Leptospira kanakyensis]MCW7482005.1 glutathione S-transferase family protein [Leptospira kanakyensis]